MANILDASSGHPYDVIFRKFVSISARVPNHGCGLYETLLPINCPPAAIAPMPIKYQECQNEYSHLKEGKRRQFSLKNQTRLKADNVLQSTLNRFEGNKNHLVFLTNFDALNNDRQTPSQDLTLSVNNFCMK